MDRKRILPLLSMFAFLVILAILPVVIQQSGFELRISALESDKPVNVVISDVASDSFSISWITEREVIGGVKLSDGTQFSESDRTSYHTVKVSGLTMSGEYSFKLLSGTKEFTQENGSDYLQKIASVSSTDEPFLISGQVFSPDGYSFQQGGIITLEFSSSIAESQVLSTVINETGGYQFDLGGTLGKNLDQIYPYKRESEVTFDIIISHDHEGVEKKYTVDFSVNRQVPNIYLGEVNIDVIPGIEGE
jgi:hypothetical protein